MRRKLIYFLPLFCMLFFFGIPAFGAENHTPPVSNEIDTVYAIDQANQTYHPVPAGDWEKIRGALDLPKQQAAENTTAKDKGGFCFVLKNGERIIYTITDSQVLAGNTPLLASIFQRQSLEKLSNTLCAANPAQPAMLAYMNVGKITRFTVKGYGETDGRVDPEKPMDFTIAARDNPQFVETAAGGLKGIRVAPGKTEFRTETPAPDSNERTIYAALEFSTGTRYDMVISDSGLLLRSSDGVRTYWYPFPDYTAGRSASCSKLRKLLWEAYVNAAGYGACALFETRWEDGERLSGAFYDAAANNGAEAPLARLSQVLDKIQNSPPVPTNQVSQRTYLEVYALPEGGSQARRFEIDASLTAYYVNSAGRGVSVKISQADWQALQSLLTGKSNRSQNTILIEKEDHSKASLALFRSADTYEKLFQPKPKDPQYKPYNTGPKPDYAVDGIHCWTGTADGGITETTVYPQAMVQQSNVQPWTPAEFESLPLYQSLNLLLEQS